MSMIRVPVACDNHDVTAVLGEENYEKGREVIGLYCSDCGEMFYAEGSCIDCHQVGDHSFNCQMNWI